MFEGTFPVEISRISVTLLVAQPLMGWLKALLK